jgi:hypothetical protein
VDGSRRVSESIRDGYKNGGRDPRWWRLNRREHAHLSLVPEVTTVDRIYPTPERCLPLPHPPCFVWPSSETLCICERVELWYIRAHRGRMSRCITSCKPQGINFRGEALVAVSNTERPHCARTAPAGFFVRRFFCHHHMHTLSRKLNKCLCALHNGSLCLIISHTHSVQRTRHCHMQHKPTAEG